MVVGVGGCLAVSQIGVSDVRSEGIILQRTSRGEVLILRQKARAIRNGVQIAPLEQVPAQRPDVGHVHYRLQADVPLHAERVVIDIRYVALRPVDLHSRRKQYAARIDERVQISVINDGVDLRWRIPSQVSDGAAGGPGVIKNPSPSSNGHFPVAEYIVCETNTRSVLHAAIPDKRDRVAWRVLQYRSVERIAGAGHDRAQENQRQPFSRNRIPCHAYTLRIQSRLEKLDLPGWL